MNSVLAQLQQSRAEVGARLASARQAAGLGVDEMARRLKMTLDQVERLEAGDWHKIGPGAYGRGYARSYAKQLGFELGDLDHCMEPSLADDDDVQAAAQVRRRRAGVQRAQRFATYIAASALIGIPLVFLVASAFRGELIKPQPEPNQDAVLASLVPRSVDNRQLRLVADATAEVRVLTADGRLISQHRLLAGDSRQIDAAAGSVVRISNPDAVRATIDGQPLALAPYRIQQAVELRIPASR